MNPKISEWHPFVFGNLIGEIYKAKAHSKIELTTSDSIQRGYIPFVTRTETNNGIDCYVLAQV